MTALPSPAGPSHDMNIKITQLGIGGSRSETGGGQSVGHSWYNSWNTNMMLFTCCTFVHSFPREIVPFWQSKSQKQERKYLAYIFKFVVTSPVSCLGHFGIPGT